MNPPSDFCVSVARNLLQLISKDGRADRRIGTALSWQLNSAIAARYGVGAVVDNVSVLMPHDLLSIQQRIRGAIEGIRRGDAVIPLPSVGPIGCIDLQISRDGLSGPLRAGWLMPDGRAAFWMGIGLALEQAGDLIQECSQADCPKLYVKLRGQKYCSTGCGQRDRSARHYQTHRAEVLEQRHESYVKRRRRQQKGARVQRRRRTG
jgi:hypothetical protein